MRKKVLNKGSTFKGPFMEFLRGVVTETGANTETRAPISTPVGRAGNLAMLIHMISLQLESIPQMVAADAFQLYLKQSDRDGRYEQNADVFATFGQAAEFLTSGNSVFPMNKDIYFDPPILYAKSQIYLGIAGTSQAAALTGGVKIGYSIAVVELEDFIEALVD